MAAAHGAVGMVSFNLPTDSRNRFELALPRARQGIYRWVDKQGKPQRTFPAIRGAATLSDSAARWLFAGAPDLFAKAITNAQKSKPQAFPLGVSVRMQTQTDVVEDVAGQNVVALLPGTDPALKGEYVVYVAHIDHLGIGRPVKGDSIYNGAHDNASGVAIDLETARLFASLPKAPRRMLQNSEANKLPTHPLYISDQKTTHLVFSFPVTYVDLGSSGLIAANAKATSAENIVRVKAASAGFPESNMTVLTSDGKLYSFVVNYQHDPKVLSLDLGAAGTEKLLPKAPVCTSCSNRTCLPAPVKQRG